VDVSIRVDGDPENLDAVVAAVLADLTDLTTNGPAAEEFASAQEQVLRNYELLNNSQLAEAVLFSAYYPEELLLEIITRYERAGAVTRGEIREAARRAITLGSYIQVELVPIGFTG
jgi:predicted Zn-dependent peptidase